MILTPEFRPWVVPFEVTGDKPRGEQWSMTFITPTLPHLFPGSVQSISGKLQAPDIGIEPQGKEASEGSNLFTSLNRSKSRSNEATGTPW